MLIVFAAVMTDSVDITDSKEVRKGLLYEDKLTCNADQFCGEVVRIAGLLDIDPDWLMFVFYEESRLRPEVVNKKSGASGLNQLLPGNLRRLGIEPEDYRKLSATEQLEYVYNYLKPFSGRMHSVTDLYDVNYLPIFLGKADSFNYTLKDGRVVNAGVWRKKVKDKYKKATL